MGFLTTAQEATQPPTSSAIEQPAVRDDGKQQMGDYVLGTGDTILIQARDVDEVPKTAVRIGLQGTIKLPLVGTVRAAGLTVSQLEDSLTREFGKYIVRPDVVIAITEFRSQPVSVLGAVRNPGVLQVQGRKNLVEILSMAGGLREDAGHKLLITRRRDTGPLPVANAQPDASGVYTTAEISVDSMLGARDPAQNIPVLPNDVITVPLAEIIYVIGEVKKPGGFPIRREEHVSALIAISMAEGMLRTAAPKSAKIIRKGHGQEPRIELAVNLKEIIEGRQPDVALQADDIVFVPNNVPKNAALRGIETALTIGTGMLIWH